MDTYVLERGDNVIKTNCINLQSLVVCITSLNGLLEIFVLLRKLFNSCIASLQNGCKSSYYRFIYWHCYTFFNSQMVLPSINQLKLIICSTMEVLKSNFKHTIYIYD